MKNKINRNRQILAVFTVFCFFLTGCVQEPQTTEVDGVEIAKSIQKSVQVHNNGKFVPKDESKETLKLFPEHITCDLKKEENYLRIDAEIIIPNRKATLYTGSVKIETLEKKKLQVITEKLQQAGLIPTNKELESFQVMETYSLYYGNEQLLSLEKTENLGQNRKPSEEQVENLRDIFKECGFIITLAPQIMNSELWDGRTYELTQMVENIPVANGFPATENNEIMETGGIVSMDQKELINLDLYNLFSVTKMEECTDLVGTDIIQKSLKKAVDTYEIVFSEGIKATGMKLEYLLKNIDGEIRLIPVWNFEFDMDSYYEYLEKNPKEREKFSMSNLCVNALDGSVIYAQ